MRAIRITEWGGPEVLELVEDLPRPEADEHHVLVRVTRAGINFADTHARENTYLARYELPLMPGAEVAGVVEEDGGGFQAGQRVVALVGTGGYAEYVAAPAATSSRSRTGSRTGRRSRCSCRGSPRGTSPDLREARGRGERRRARRRRRGRLARGAARQAARAPGA